MPGNRVFMNVKLQDCCRKALTRIHNSLEAGHALSWITMTSGFWGLLVEPPPFVIFHLFETDWDAIAEATKTIPLYVRSECAEAADLEILNHPGGELYRFWKAMDESFEWR